MAYYRKISNCPVTQTTSNIIYPFIGDKNNPWYKIYGGYNTGMDIDCDNVYAICPCVCIYVGKETNNKYYDAIVQYDSKISFAYCHLDKVYIKAGDIVDNASLIGTAHKFCSFEYLSSTQGYSMWAVRVASKQMYCQDPEEYVDGSIKLLGSGLANPEADDVDIDAVYKTEDFPESTVLFYGDGY